MKIGREVRANVMWLPVALLAACSGATSDTGSRGPTGGDAPSDVSDPVEGGSANGDAFGNPNADPGAQDGITVVAGPSDGTCARADVFIDRIRPRIVFLVDSSTSMKEDFGEVSRWDALRDSLLLDEGLVPTLHELVKFGLVTYAGPRFTTCPALRYAAPAPSNLAFVGAAFPEAPPDESSTPTGAAMDWAIDNAFTDGNSNPDVRPEPQYMIFATDGEPNGCAMGTDDEPARDFDGVIAAAHKAESRGIKIFVISLAEASGEFAEHLAQVAAIGQTDHVFSPQTKADLVSELETIVGAAISCEVELDGRVKVGRECEGEVSIDGEPLACNGENGWELVDERHILFKGQACDDFRLSPSARAAARFPCEALE